MVIFTQLLNSLVIFDFLEKTWAVFSEENANKLVVLAGVTFFICELYLPILKSVCQIDVLDPFGAYCSWFLSVYQLRMT